MSMQEFWVSITQYMDKLHLMEVGLLEELENCNCEGTFEDLDLLSLSSTVVDGEQRKSAEEAANKMTLKELKDAFISLSVEKDGRVHQRGSAVSEEARRPSASQAPAAASSDISKENERPALEEWEISLYDVEFHKRSE